MADPIGGLNIELSANTATLVKDLGKARQDFGKFRNDINRNMQGLQQTFSKLGQVFAAVFVSGAIGRGISNVANLGDELSKMSQKTGLTVETLNGLTQAAALADVSSEQLTKGIFQLNKNLLDTTRGTGEAKVSFAAMGVGAKEAADLLKHPDQAFLDIAGRLASIRDPSVRAAEAMKIFGKAGAEMLPLLNQGKEAIAAQIVQYQKLRPITTEQAKAAEAFNDSMTAFNHALQGLAQQGLGPVLPVLTDVFDKLTALTQLNYSDAFSTLFPRLDTLAEKLEGIRGKLRSTANELGSFVFKNLTQGTQDKFQEFVEKLAGVKFVPGGGKKPPNPTTPPSIDTLPTTTVNERAQSAELQSLIDLREARIKLIEAEEADDEIKSDRVNILNEEIALLKESLAIQKEIEDANKEGKVRAVDETVALTANIAKQARLKEIQNERVELFKKLNAEEQEILGADIQHALNIERQTQQQGILNQFTKEQQDIQRAIAQAGDDTAQVRGGQILLIESRINFLKKENETLGETKARNEQLKQLQIEINDLRAEGNRIQQEGLGRGIVSGASADLERQLADRQRAVRDAEQQLELGSIARGQTREQQRVREIQLIEAKLALLQQEQRLGLITTEQADNQTELLVAQFSNASNPKGFLEGWQETFAQFTDDAQGAFGLGQTLARQFTQNVQQLGASITQNVFNKLEEGTLTWKSALETIPDILQQITSQLIGMAIAQGVASAIGGGLGGLFGGGAPGATPAAAARGAANPALFGPGFASGTDFMVGGRGGVDANFFPMRLTKGERVRVETPAQQRESRGGNTTVNIINNAGVDIQQQERQTPNGNVLDVMIDRRVRRVNRQEFGLSHKPGRTG